MKMLCGLFVVIAGITDAIYAQQPRLSFENSSLAKATIVVGADTGQILYANNAEQSLNPASMSKVMVAYLVMEAIENGQFTLDTPVTVSQNDAAISQLVSVSNIPFTVGEVYTVRELLTFLFVSSASAATIMLARQVVADDQVFVEKMNEKARELGLTQTQFYHATGAELMAFEGYYQPNDQVTASNQMSAQDTSRLTYYLLKRFPDLLSISQQQSITTRKGERITATNHSLPGGKFSVEGVTGLKTGSSPDAGYNIVVTAKRGDVSVIAVVMGVGTWGDFSSEQARHIYVEELLEKTFETYTLQTVVPAGKYDRETEWLFVEQDVRALVAEGESAQVLQSEKTVYINGPEGVIVSPQQLGSPIVIEQRNLFVEWLLSLPGIATVGGVLGMLGISVWLVRQRKYMR